eukprot:c17533_g1_i1 orf=661-2172(-)
MIKQILNRLPRNRNSFDGSEAGGRSVAPPVESSNGSGSNKELLATTQQLAVPVLSSASDVHMANGANKIGPIALGVASKTRIEPLPLFRDVPISERPTLFIAKLNLCSNVYDFRDPTKNLKEKDIKKQTLLELVDFISAGNIQISEQVIEEVTKMVAANLFRALPPSMHENAHLESFDMEDEEPTLEPAWPHLQVVYEFFLRFITSADTEARVAKVYINQSFVLKLMELFDSEDSRERDYLKTVLHRIYGKFMVHRAFIRKAVNNVFYRFVFETERHNGIAELLEILGSIINGFAVPLKEEHKVFLARALMPLHKAKCVSMYHRQLCYCMTQFIEKDSKLAEVVIRGLLKYWPLTNSHKEVLFLNELEEVLEVTQPEEFQRCMVPLFRQVGRCLNSPHFQVAERALFLWNNDHFVTLVIANRPVILPIIFPALEKNTNGHWNQAIHGMTMNARRLFLETDQELFQECKRRFKEEEANAAVLKEKQNLMWQQLEVAASSKGTVK